MTDSSKQTATLLITAPDRKGLVHAISLFLLEHNGNIIHADQHEDAIEKLFLMRVEWDMQGFTLQTREAIERAFTPVAEAFGMSWQVHFSHTRRRIALFTSQYEHCLSDLLHRHRIGELNCDIPLVIGNHDSVRDLVERHGIPFHHIVTTRENKAEAEARQLALLEEANVDTIVLARYMQILSPVFVQKYPNQVINIHHSFLPAFDGAKPYHRAHARGVKLIGATSHYVTDELDEGPIIEQEVTRVSHRDDIPDLIEKGRDLEKIVLARAVKWHLQSRVLSYNNKTVVFD